MNNNRRKSITDLKSRIETLKSQIEEIKDELESIQDEEQEAYENMPESFQDGEKGEKAQACIDAISDAFYNIETVNDELADAIESLETAVEK